jgi:hypothetical protein
MGDSKMLAFDAARMKISEFCHRDAFRDIPAHAPLSIITDPRHMQLRHMRGQY